MTTAVLIGLVTAHTLMNVALMRLPQGNDLRFGRVFFHFFLPGIATLLFWWVLWESLFPLAYPLGWSLALWVMAIVPATFFARLRGGRLAAEDAHQLGTSRLS
jgi:hypothetical protein